MLCYSSAARRQGHKPGHLARHTQTKHVYVTAYRVSCTRQPGREYFPLARVQPSLCCCLPSPSPFLPRVVDLLLTSAPLPPHLFLPPHPPCPCQQPHQGRTGEEHARASVWSDTNQHKVWRCRWQPRKQLLTRSATGKTRSEDNSDAVRVPLLHLQSRVAHTNAQSGTETDDDPTPRKSKQAASRKAAGTAATTRRKKQVSKPAPPATVPEPVEGFKTDSPFFSKLKS